MRLRPKKKKKTFVSTNMPKNIRVGRSEILFISYADFMAKLLLGAFKVFNKITIKHINYEE